MQPVSREFDAMNKINTPLNQHQISPLHEIHHHQMLANSQFDPATLHDDFLEQFLSTVPSSVAASFPWAEDHVPPHLEEQSDTLLAAKLRHNQISSTAKALMIQQQLLFSRGLTDGGLLSRPQDDQSDVVDGNSFNSVFGIGQYLR